MGNLRNKVQLIGNVGQDPVITDFENAHGPGEPGHQRTLQER